MKFLLDIFPLGLAYISATLKEAGFEVRRLYLNHLEGTVEGALEKAIAETDPDAIGTGALPVHYPVIKPIL